MNTPSSDVVPNMGANTLTGETVINQGTLSLNGGTNTLSYDNYLEVGVGGTLNLNGTCPDCVMRLFT